MNNLNNRFFISSAIIIIFLSAIAINLYAQPPQPPQAPGQGQGGQIWQISQGGTGTSSFSNGGVLFSDGTKLTQDKENFFWNANTSWGEGVLVFGTNITPQTITRLYVASPHFGHSISLQAPNETEIASIGFFTSFDAETAAIGIESSPAAFLPLSANLEDLVIVNEKEGKSILLGTPDSTGTILERMRINHDGNIGIGTTSPATLLQVAGSISASIAGSDNGVRLDPAGCIVIQDSDGNGITYITANDGILTATTTKPNICQ